MMTPLYSIYENVFIYLFKINFILNFDSDNFIKNLFMSIYSNMIIKSFCFEFGLLMSNIKLSVKLQY